MGVNERPHASRVFGYSLALSVTLHAMISLPAGVALLLERFPELARLLGRTPDTDQTNVPQSPSEPDSPIPSPIPTTPPPQEVRLGIDDSDSASIVWMGFADATPHEAPKSEIDQSAMTPANIGMPVEPGAEEQTAAEAVAAPPAADAPQPEPSFPELTNESPATPESIEPAQSTSDQPVQPVTDPIEQVSEPIPDLIPEPMPEPITQPEPSTPPIEASPPPADLVPEPIEEAKAIEPTEAPLVPEVESEQVEPSPPLETPIDQPPIKDAPPEQVVPEPAARLAPAIHSLRQRLIQIQRAAIARRQSIPTPSDPIPAAPAAPSPVMPEEARAAAPGGVPVLPGEQGIQSDKESDATSTTLTALYRNGKVKAGEGLDIKTVRPNFSKYTKVTAVPTDPIVEIWFDRRGMVRNVEMKRSSGYRDVDEPVKNAVWAWTARGRVLEELAARRPDGVVKIEITLLLRG